MASRPESSQQRPQSTAASSRGSQGFASTMDFDATVDVDERASAQVDMDALREIVRAAAVNVQMVDLEAVIRFVFPAELQHAMSTGRLLAFGFYGPLDVDAQLRSGHKGSHVVGRWELDTMCRQFEREDILQVYMHSGKSSSSLSEAEAEELLAQADSRLKVAKGKAMMRQVTPSEVRQLFDDLPRDAQGRLNFHDMQVGTHRGSSLPPPCVFAIAEHTHTARSMLYFGHYVTTPIAHFVLFWRSVGSWTTARSQFSETRSFSQTLWVVATKKGGLWVQGRRRPLGPQRQRPRSVWVVAARGGARRHPRATASRGTAHLRPCSSPTRGSCPWRSPSGQTSCSPRAPIRSRGGGGTALGAVPVLRPSSGPLVAMAGSPSRSTFLPWCSRVPWFFSGASDMRHQRRQQPEPDGQRSPAPRGDDARRAQRPRSPRTLGQLPRRTPRCCVGALPCDLPNIFPQLLMLPASK